MSSRSRERAVPEPVAVTASENQTNSGIESRPRWLPNAGAVTGSIGLSAIVLGNVATILTHVEAIRLQLLKWIDIGSLLKLHSVVSVGAAVVVTIGYALIAYWIYANYITTRSKNIQRISAVIGLLGIPVVAFLSLVAAAPATSDSILRQQASQFADAIAAAQVSSGPNKGGFRFNLGAGSSETQAWTTAQCLVALLGRPEAFKEHGSTLRTGLEYLERVNIPDQGWGYVTRDTIGVTEINAWVLIAETLSLSPHDGRELWVGAARQAMLDRTWRDLGQLANRQHDDGGWGPLARTSRSEHLRTYSTVMALWALVEARDNQLLSADRRWGFDENIKNGARWLLTHYVTQDGISGWFPNPAVNHPSGQFPGLTGQILYVLERASREFPSLAADQTLDGARTSFLALGERGASGFAPFGQRRLAENQRAHDTDRYLPPNITVELPEAKDFKAESSTFLWFPWSLASAVEIERDDATSARSRQSAQQLIQALVRRGDEMRTFTFGDEAIYPMAETLFALNRYLTRKTAKP